MTTMLETFEAPSQPLVDERQAAFARLVAGVIDTLNRAVEHRVDEGSSRSKIAAKIGCDKSSLSRALRASDKNLTLKTISDILWACDFEAEEFEAAPIEDILAARAQAQRVWRRPQARRDQSSNRAFSDIHIQFIDEASVQTSTDVALEGRVVAFSQ